MEKLKGIKYTRTEEEIREYMKVPVEIKLRRLEEFNRLAYGLTMDKRLKMWEKFRRGKI
jgi:hypothetical protein